MMQIQFWFALSVANDIHYMPDHGENFASGFHLHEFQLIDFVFLNQHSKNKQQ